MSIFQDNITSELTIGNVFDVSIDASDFVWIQDDDLCKDFFFKWVYDDCESEVSERVIKRISELPISLIEKCLKDDVRPFRRQLKKFVKHKYSNDNHLSIVRNIKDTVINICIEETVPGIDWKPETYTFKIVLIRK